MDDSVRRTAKFATTMIALSGATALMMGNAGGRAAVAGVGNTGAPGENAQICVSCHNGGAYGPIIVLLEPMQAGQIVASYVPGRTYDFRLTVAAGQGNPAGYGFQMTALDNANANVGTFKNLGANVKESVAVNTGNRKYLEHKGGASANRVFTMKWTAPPAKTGDVDFYYIGNVVNGNNAKTGDNGGLGSSITLSERGAHLPLPYFDDFEFGDGGWMSWSEPGGDPWVTGVAQPATLFETGAWGAAGSGTGGGLAHLESPPLDLSGLIEDPVISFAIQYDTGAGVGGWLEFSTDEGQSWDKLGGVGDGLGWYDAVDPVWGDWWTGTTSGWSYSEIELEGLAGEEHVRLRWVFTSGQGTSLDTFGIDDFLFEMSIDEPDPPPEGGSSSGGDWGSSSGDGGSSSSGGDWSGSSSGGDWGSTSTPVPDPVGSSSTW